MTSKKETKAELKEEIREEKTMEGQWNTIIVIVLAVALILTFFQAVQMNAIGSTVVMHEDMIVSFSQGNYTAQPSTTQASSTVPQSLQNVPDMVGGC